MCTPLCFCLSISFILMRKRIVCICFCFCLLTSFIWIWKVLCAPLFLVSPFRSSDSFLLYRKSFMHEGFWQESFIFLQKNLKFPFMKMTCSCMKMIYHWMKIKIVALGWFYSWAVGLYPEQNSHCHAWTHALNYLPHIIKGRHPPIIQSDYTESYNKSFLNRWSL